MEALGLAPSFFAFLSLDHANNNVHNIRLCRQIVAAGSLPAAALREQRLAERVVAVLAYAHQNAVEPFLEPVLQLCLALVHRDAADTRAGASSGELLTQLLPQLPIFADLSSHAEAPVAAAASACLAALVLMYAAEAAAWLLGREGAGMILAALHGGGPDAPACSAAQQNVAAALAALDAGGGGAPLAAVPPSEELSQLGEALAALAADGGAEPTLRMACSAALAVVQQALGGR